jgi:hypothetical protein
VARTLPKLGPKTHMLIGTGLLTLSLLWLSTVDANTSYLGKLLPGMLLLAVAMGNLFVPLTVTAVSKVEHTDAGLASALLNVGQQVGGALGLSVMTTVFGTSARNYAAGHFGGLIAGVKAPASGMTQQTQNDLIATLQHAGSSGLQPDQIQQFVRAHPDSAQFFHRGGSYQHFTHNLLAHASGQGFLMGAVFGLAAIVAAAVLINVTKQDLPAESMQEVAAAA